MNRRGMTLLELVVALTVSGAAMAAGYGAFAQMVDQRERMRAATDAVNQAATVRRDVSAWLAGAKIGLGGDGPEFRGLDGVAGDLPDDEITFMTDAATPLGDVTAVVRLYVDRDPATPEIGLVAELTEFRGSATTRIELVPNATGLDVQYVSAILGGDRWMPSWISRTVLPRGVQLRLSTTPGDSLPPLLQLPITVPVGSGR
jgi:prepilin-type N-terminal cleavage/methylation domain-containing protein